MSKPPPNTNPKPPSLKELEEEIQHLKAEQALESALERVRKIALEMSEPGDMLNVCGVISDEMSEMGIKNIRNIQTFIFHQHDKSYLNFQYYSAYGNSVVETIDYDQNQVVQEMVNHIKGKKDVYYSNSMSGKELKAFIEYRIKNNQFHDPLLEQSEKVDYYFYALGNGALGFTKYGSATEREVTIFKRFCQVFSLIYQRFRDLETAKSQAREAQIEAALERVRAASMAMHTTGELNKIIAIVFTQLRHLGFDNVECEIILFDPEKLDCQIWPSNEADQVLPRSYHIPNNKYKFYKFLLESWQSGKDYCPYELKGMSKKAWENWLFNQTDWKNIPEAVQKSMREVKKIFLYGATTSHGILEVGGLQRLEEGMFEIIQRFAKVFEQSYTRFLDLKKAEAQAREAQIEAALERIRAASMAMHKSEEFSQVAEVLANQFDELNIDYAGFSINIIDPEDMSALIYVADVDLESGQRIVTSFATDKIMDLWVGKEFNSRWLKDEDNFTVAIKGKHLKEFINFTIDGTGTDRGLQDADLECLYYHISFFDGFSCLGINTLEPLPEENQEIFRKMAKTFGMSYRRFQDLQKAEAQAREAQIEAALERVRAASMAMHNTNELTQVVNVLMQQIEELGIDCYSSLIVIPDESNFSSEMWMSNDWKSEFKNPLKFPMDKRLKWSKEWRQAWEKRSPIFQYKIEGKSLDRFCNHMFTKTDFIHVPEEVKTATLEKKHIYNTTAFCANAGLMVNSDHALDEESKMVLMRFARVFEQSYTRFLDLQKAEAQAREAQIEAALERVRSRAMAMHQSNELSQVVKVMFTQFQIMGLTDQWSRVAITIIDEISGHVSNWITTLGGDEIAHSFEFNISDNEYWKKLFKSFKKIPIDKRKEHQFTIVHKGEKLDEVLGWAREINLMTPEEESRFELSGYQSWIENTNLYANGTIIISQPETLSEESYKLLKRFTSVFEQSYTRFLDLQKAEAQAREAQIEAALERVRAATMAMHQSSELANTSITLFQQAKILGFPIARCGFDIIDKDEDQYKWTAWRASVDGNIINEPQVITFSELKKVVPEVIEAWSNGENSYHTVWSGQQTKKFWEGLQEELAKPKNTEDYETFSQFTIHLNIFWNKYGGLNISTFDALSDELIQIGVRLSKVFEQTYTRFLDLQKAEAQAREAQIEAALERVRAASMAMHKSEDLHQVIIAVYNQLELLGLKVHSAQISDSLYDKKNLHCWIAANNQVYPEQLIIPITKNTFFTRFQLSQQKGETSYSQKLTKRQKNNFFKNFFEYSGITNVPKSRQDFIYSSPGLDLSTFITKDFAISIMRYDGISYRIEENEIIKRFGKVFEQSYTRFQDLKKAEAQAREAQIEAALERVRARTMAMHDSSDIADTVLTFFKELTGLGLDPSIRCGVGILSESEEMRLWTASKGENDSIALHSGSLDMTIHPLLVGVKESWKKKKSTFSYKLEAEDTKAYFKAINKARYYPLKIDLRKLPSIIFQRTFIFKDGGLYVFSETLLDEGVQDIFNRFSKVFGQAYTRYKDLVSAEARAREAQIEAALERVRAASMAMHKSEAIRNVAEVTFKQLKDLEIQADLCLIDVFKEKTDDLFLWGATSEQIYNQEFHVPKFNHTYFRALAKAKGHTNHLFSFSFNKAQTKRWHDHLLNASEIGKNINQERKKRVLKASSIDGLEAIQKHHGLIIYNFSKYQYTEDECEVLLRTSQVFEQAYIRFLDLKKVEKQAREAQIEAALERVRAKTMAMHKSNELESVVKEVFEELKNFDMNIDVCAINILDGTKNLNLWTATPDMIYPQRIDIPYLDNPMFNGIHKAYEQNKSLLTDVLTRDEKDTFYHHFFKHSPQSRHTTSKRREAIKTGEKFTRSVALAKHTSLLIANFRDHVYSDFENSIISRFSQVFEQTYTRFLDLQKAEAQAREAQIEASLERIRAKALAMHNSDDISDATIIIFQELNRLGISTLRCGILIGQENHQMEVWTAVAGEEQDRLRVVGKLDMNNHPMFKGIYKAWKAEDPSFNYRLAGKNLHRYYEALDAMPEYNTDNITRYLKPHTFHWFGFGEGGLFTFMADDMTPDINQVFNRFASVFSLTYRRYLDLVKAEKQAREAEVEASLERVRAKAMAMHSSEDLSETVSLLLNELEGLNIYPVRCGFGRVFEETKTSKLYIAKKADDGHQMELVGTVVLDGHPVFEGIFEGFKNKKPYLPVLKGKLMTSYYKKLKEFLEVEKPPKGTIQYGYFDWYNDAGLYAWSESPFSEETQAIYKKFTAVLGLTFNRYNDLKDAEARALEALKDASLDRVRAEIASMRTSEDLDRITPVIWRELISLEVPFIRCGVFIVDEEIREVKAYLSTPDGKGLGVLNLPFDVNEQTTNTVNYWRRKEVYTEHWDADQFIEWTQSMVKMGQVKSATSYQGSSKVPKELHLHFVPFRQGMLYVGDKEPLQSEKIEMVKTLAEAFSIAYARYEDFQNLESAKNKVEATLNDLKAAQAQLVQSEKMASLGELTAGIAHEIQNPLNFVNNFSEVSYEIIDEAIEELEAGDQEEAQAILQDLKSNLEKIAHHGQRASGIVKSMLDHSRTSSGEKVTTDINTLCDEYLRLAYHGMRAKDRSFNAAIETAFDESLPKIEVIPQEIGRVILNLINNALQAIQDLQGFKNLEGLDPKVEVSTKNLGDLVQISVSDNGHGIPDDIKDKIFQPFFTTKPTGQGTGLGLSLSYDIIKSHGGEISVHSTPGTGTTFLLTLPMNNTHG